MVAGRCHGRLSGKHTTNYPPPVSLKSRDPELLGRLTENSSFPNAQDRVSWVMHGLRQYYLPTRIALNDLAKKQLLREVDLEPFGMNAV